MLSDRCPVMICGLAISPVPFAFAIRRFPRCGFGSHQLSKRRLRMLDCLQM